MGGLAAAHRDRELVHVSLRVVECVKFVVDPVTVTVDVREEVPGTVPPQLMVIRNNISEKVARIPLSPRYLTS